MNKKDQILEIKNYNVEQDIYPRANRLIDGGIFVPFPITQTDILFREFLYSKILQLKIWM